MTMVVETKKSFCRVCHAFCGMQIDIEDNRIIGVKGDAEHPVSQGFTCIKGRNMPEQHHHPDRLRHPLKRMADGSFRPISSELAMDEIAGRLSSIIQMHGPRAVASYMGTFAFLYAGTVPIARTWHRSFGSPSIYSSITIDQPAKRIAAMRQGVWDAGDQRLEEADVLVAVGTNPLVSVSGGPRFYGTNPAKRLADARKRGMKLIVIDPRRSETAKRADLHLQVKPGEDPTLLAGLVNIILDEEIYDQEFCAQHVSGLQDLRDAVSAFAPDYVEQRTGVSAEQLISAARLFATAKRGGVTSGTGTSMSPRSNLTEQLILTLNTICGRYLREGELVPNPGTLTPERPRFAQAMGGDDIPQGAQRSRLKGLGALGPATEPKAWLTAIDEELPTTVLADEMLTPGEGRVRALITVGGNPVVAWPDQLKTIQALRSLELSVIVDIKMSATAKTCDYIFAGKLGLERPDITLLGERYFPIPFQQYAPALIEPEGDVIEDWELYYGLAKRLGHQLELAGGPVPMDHKPSGDQFLDLVCAGSRISLDEIRQHPGGAVFPLEVRIQPRQEGHPTRLMVGHREVLAELREVRAETITGTGSYESGATFSHRLINRRLREVYNSSTRDVTAVQQAGVTTNFAYMNPLDLATFGIHSGDIIQITSDRASIPAVAEASDDIPSGVISMSHAWGDVPELDHQVRTKGSPTNRLVNLDRHWEPYTGMPRQSAIPVNVRTHVETARPNPIQSQPSGQDGQVEGAGERQ